MTALPATESSVQSVTVFDDDAWEDLLNFVEERRVIPIVGPELATVQTDAGTENLYAWRARSLAARLGQVATNGAHAPTLNDVIVRHLANRGRREDLYTRIRTIMREATFAPPPALLKLAAITDFDLYVSTTFDSLIEDALNTARFSGLRTTDVAAYTPNKLVDLPVEREFMQRPLVYHLMGRLSASPTYVISDEDVLEFICALQATHYAPQRLLGELEHNHLLLLGGGFSDWLTRMFLRLAKRRRLSEPRDFGEVLADSHAPHEPGLVFFLQQVSSRTRLFTGGAERFVDELHRRWMARHQPAAVPADTAGAPARFTPPARDMADNAVFISYAREDLAAVQHLKTGLAAVGIVAWFDLDRLEGGDDFMRKIRGTVARCSYFIPVITGRIAILARRSREDADDGDDRIGPVDGPTVQLAGRADGECFEHDDPAREGDIADGALAGRHRDAGGLGIEAEIVDGHRVAARRDRRETINAGPVGGGFKGGAFEAHEGAGDKRAGGGVGHDALNTAGVLGAQSRRKH